MMSHHALLSQYMYERRKGRERDTAKENILAHVAVRAYLDAHDSRLSLSRGSRSSQCSHQVGGGGGGGGEGRAVRRGRGGGIQVRKQVRLLPVMVSHCM